MLLGKDRSRHQIYYLPALLHCLKCCTKCHLCLAISNVSADQTIHDLTALHIMFGVHDRFLLIFCLLIREQFFKFFLPDSIWSVYIAFLRLTGRIQFHQILCHQLYSAPHSGLGLLPVLSAQRIQLRYLLPVGTAVFLDRVQLGCQNIEAGSLAVLDLHIIFDCLIHRNFLNTTVDTKSMIFMHHIVAHVQITEASDPGTFIRALFPVLFLLFFSKYIRF